MNQINMDNVKARDTVKVRVESKLSRKVYEGSFRWRRRTLADIGEIAATQSAMTGGANIVIDSMASLIGAIAELTVVIEKAPDWWQEVKDISDTGVIYTVYRRYLEWMAAPFREQEEEDEGPDSDTGEGE